MRADEIEGLEGLYDGAQGPLLPLPETLSALYGPLRLPAPADRPYLMSNFVASLDGVVSLGEPGTGGDDISGGSREDRFVMGLLRAAADAVVVGAGTLRAFPRHLWTPEAICGPYADSYAQLRAAMGKSAPLTVIVTATGDVDPRLPVFATARAPVAVVTTEAGARRFASRSSDVKTLVAGAAERLSAREILRVLALPAGSRILLECGPTLMGRFLADGLVDELFLTLAPQVAGRTRDTRRDGLVAEAAFLPANPLWGELASVKRCRSVLFLRYRFGHSERAAE